MAHNMSVQGIYSDRTTVSDALNVLHKAGFRTTDHSVLSSDNQGTKDFGHEQHTRGAEVAGKCAVVGGVAGAALGWFFSTQTLAVAGLAPMVAAGPVVAAFAGAGAGGALGWIAGVLTGMRQIEYVARRYAGRIRHGGILLSVHCDSPEWSARAKKMLKDTGARHISSAPEAAADYGTTDRPSDRAPAIEMVPAVVAVRSETPLPVVVKDEFVQGTGK